MAKWKHMALELLCGRDVYVLVDHLRLTSRIENVALGLDGINSHCPFDGYIGEWPLAGPCGSYRHDLDSINRKHSLKRANMVLKFTYLTTIKPPAHNQPHHQR